MVKAKEYGTGFTCQNFFPGNFHGLESVDRDLHRKLMRTEDQVYSRQRREGHGILVMETALGHCSKNDEYALKPCPEGVCRRITTGETEASGYFHSQGVFCLLFTIQMVF